VNAATMATAARIHNAKRSAINFADRMFVIVDDPWMLI
jgi:hypothetical protein